MNVKRLINTHEVISMLPHTFAVSISQLVNQRHIIYCYDIDYGDDSRENHKAFKLSVCGLRVLKEIKQEPTKIEGACMDAASDKPPAAQISC